MGLFGRAVNVYTAQSGKLPATVDWRPEDLGHVTGTPCSDAAWHTGRHRWHPPARRGCDSTSQ